MMRYAKDSRLIFDLGLNNGDDTDFYLKRGFSVVTHSMPIPRCVNERRGDFRQQLAKDA